MKTQFEKTQQDTEQGVTGDLFGAANGVSPEDAGRSDARTAMASAAQIIKDAATRLKSPQKSARL